jgi:cell division septal protein FtsQ
VSGPSAVPVPSRPTPPQAHRWGWTLGLVGVLLALAAVVVLHSPWMSVREVEIIGAVHADAAGRLAAAGVGDGAIMIWLNPGEIEEAVAADPWVREVRVERIFPGRLVIEVLEHTPVVWVGGEETWMLVARAGVVIATGDAPAEGLLRAQVFYEDHAPGEQPEGAEWGELAALGPALGPELAARAWVTREGGELWLEADGCRARLGPATQLADKGRAFAALLAEGLPAGSRVDLISPMRPAVTGPVGEAGNGESEPVG